MLAGRTYTKIEGNAGPDLRLEAVADGLPPAIMGDALRATSASFTARVTGAGLAGGAKPGPYLLLVFKDGLPLLAAPILTDDFTLPFPSLGVGRYRLQLMRLSGVGAINALSSPIHLDPNAAPDKVYPGPAPVAPGGGGGGGSGGSGSALAGRCATPLMGTPKRDRLLGGEEGESLIGLAGRDRLLGRGGKDCLYGGPGSDRLGGGGGADMIFGGPGNDAIGARDGVRETVNCGGGRRDRAVVDSADRVRGCEVAKAA